MPLSVTLQVFRGGQPAGQLQFNSVTHRVLKLGKLASAQIKIDDPTVSRVHAVIDISHTQATLIDMGSEAGTLVNGARVNQAKLKTNDQIAIGNTMLVVTLDAAMALPTVPHGQPLAPPAPAYGAPAPVPGYAAPPYATPASPYGSPAYVPQPPQNYAPAVPPPRPGRPLPASAPTAAPAYMPATGIVMLTPASPTLAAKLHAMSRDQLAVVESFVDLMNARGPAAAQQVLAQAAQPPGLASRLDLAMTDEPWQPVHGKDTERLIGLLKRGRKRRYLIALVAATALVIGMVALLPDTKTDGQVPPPDLAAAPTPAPAAAPRDDTHFAYLRLREARALNEVAQAVWGDHEHAPLLVQHNSDAGDASKPVAPGSVIKVPRFSEYVVEEGDTLGYIAEDLLGEAKLYTVIYEANRDVLPDPSGVAVGMKLKVPILPPAAEQKLMALGVPP